MHSYIELPQLATHVLASSFLVVAAMAKAIERQKYEAWVEGEFRHPITKLLLKRGVPGVELALGIAFLVQALLNTAPYGVVVVMAALVCVQFWLRKRKTSCQCVGSISNSTPIRIAPWILLALATLTAVCEDTPHRLTLDVYGAGIIVWFAILAYAFHRLVGASSSRRIALAQDQPRNGVATSSATGQATAFELPVQLGFDAVGKPLFSADRISNTKAVILVFLSAGCRHCMDTLEDVCIFSHGYRNLLRSFLFVSSNDKLAKKTIDTCGAQMVDGWEKHFSNLGLTGYPASIVCDARTGKAIGPLVYGADKIRLLFAMTVSAARADG